MRANFLRTLGSILLLGLAGSRVSCAELKELQLPPVQVEGGKPLMQALKQRQTIREFKSDPLPAQSLANLLWAAFGINRPGTGHRTAPSAMNSQEVDIYVALPEGVFLYDAGGSSLKPVFEGDLRSQAGSQDFAKAPITLIYVADLTRLAKADAQSRRFYAAFDTGCICQNVYLYCASAGLATVVHELDRKPLETALKLRSEQQIIMAQAVGVPKVGITSRSAP